MKIWKFLVIGVLLAVGVIACSFRPPAAANFDDDWLNGEKSKEKIKVLATTAMIGDLVKNVGGEHVDVKILIQGEMDPHTYELMRGDQEKFDHADLVVCNGLGLEHGRSLAEELARNNKVLSLGDNIQENAPDLVIYVDDAGTPDPHMWMNLEIWRQGVVPVQLKLQEMMPAYEVEFATNAIRISEDYLSEHQALVKMMHAIPPQNRYLVTSHDAFHYYAKGYLATEDEQQDGTWKKRVCSPEGLAPDGHIGAVDIKKLINYINKHHVTVMFSEANVSPRSLKKILDSCRQNGIEVEIAKEKIYADSLGAPESDAATLREMLRYNSDVIYTNLKKMRKSDGK